MPYSAKQRTRNGAIERLCRYCDSWQSLEAFVKGSKPGLANGRLSKCKLCHAGTRAPRANTQRGEPSALLARLSTYIAKGLRRCPGTGYDKHEAARRWAHVLVNPDRYCLPRGRKSRSKLLLAAEREKATG